MPDELEQLQSLLRETLLMQDADQAAEKIKKQVKAKDCQDTKERLDIYRFTLLQGLTNILCENFPQTRKLLSDQDFIKLCHDYIRQTPPANPNMNLYGYDFPAWLQKQNIHALAIDMARFEWGWHHCFWAEDDGFLSETQTSDQDWLTRHEADLQLRQAVQIIDSPYPLSELYDKLSANDWEHLPNCQDTTCRHVFILQRRSDMKQTISMLENVSADDIVIWRNLQTERYIAVALQKAAAVVDPTKLGKILAICWQKRLITVNLSKP